QCSTSVSLRHHRRLPAPPPLPYTTLFRSRVVALRQPLVGANQLLGQPIDPAGRQRGDAAAAPAGCLFRLRFATVERHDRDVRVGDRKSTRLNSSHVSISYAVFCLKKKTNA